MGYESTNGGENRTNGFLQASIELRTDSIEKQMNNIELFKKEE
jgi:hypothetical protein